MRDNPGVSPDRPAPRADDSVKELRHNEAQALDGLAGERLHAAVSTSTWHYSATWRWAELVLVAICPTGLVVAMVIGTAQHPGTTTMWVLVTLSVLLVVVTTLWVVAAIRHPHTVCLDADGVTVTGARLPWPSARPRLYRWADCSPFAVHVIYDDGDRFVARCLHRTGDLIFERSYGDPRDLVTILNAYRTAYTTE